MTLCYNLYKSGGIHLRNSKSTKATGEIAIKKHGFVWNITHYKTAYLLILPAIILVFTLSYLPFLGLVLAFKDYDIITGIWGSPWVGFDNFKEVFSNPNMLGAIKN